MENLKEYAIAEYPGFFGKRRDQRHADFDQKYGKGNWIIAREVRGTIISDSASLMLYEDGYYNHLLHNRGCLDWLLRTASDVYDNAETNVNSGLDYSMQENNGNHLQDIAIRRAVIRLGEQFRGDHLVKVREPESEGYRLMPGQVPFHLPEIIRNPRQEGWWKKDSVEDFWQSNKVIAVRKVGSAEEFDRQAGCRW